MLFYNGLKVLCTIVHIYDMHDETYIAFTTRFRGDAKVGECYTKPKENTPDTKNTVVYKIIGSLIIET